MEYSDNELYSMVCESSEEAKELLYQKYKYMIDGIIKNYAYAAKKLGVEYNDLYQEALVGFSDALNRFDESKNVQMSTFISLCVKRRLQSTITKAGRMKNQMLLDSLSLDYTYGNVSLKELIVDEKNKDPLKGITGKEELLELLEAIQKALSKQEYEVYEFIIQGLTYQEIALLLNKSPKQIDNAIQRMKGKIRNILKEVF